MAQVEYTDVLVCGAGPVGLLVALGLAQQGVDTIVIEKRERHVQETFGRACTLYPRSLELLEPLDVVDSMTQASFQGRSYAVFRDGKRVARKAWQSMFPMMDSSFHNYIMTIRQKNSESIFADRYKVVCGRDVEYGWSFVDQHVDKRAKDGYHVTATMSHAVHGQRTVKCKYLVGADGGSSTVRRLADIPMEGNDTEYRWVRIDGKMKTDMPVPNTVFTVLETQTHGHLLWIKLDQDSHRIGFALTKSMQEKYPDGINEEEVIHEAKESMKPFTLEIQRLDWWTQYNVKQKVAKTMQTEEYILLTGDAGHLHSSAFAQGMNTGVHDATNLAWKLGGVLKGWYKPEVLATYSNERRSAAERLISIDRLVASLASGEMPEGLENTGMSRQVGLRTIMDTNMSFTTGLGVSYDEPSVVVSENPTATTLVPGARCPDALLRAPGPAVPLRLYDIFAHRSTGKGRWNMLIFGGNHHLTQSKVIALRDATTMPGGAFASHAERFNFATIIIGHVGSAWDAFNGPALGNLYFDPDATAHNRYGIYADDGAIVVIRPDGIFAYAAGLEEVDKIGDFFKPIFT